MLILYTAKAARWRTENPEGLRINGELERREKSCKSNMSSLIGRFRPMADLAPTKVCSPTILSVLSCICTHLYAFVWMTIDKTSCCVTPSEAWSSQSRDKYRVEVELLTTLSLESPHSEPAACLVTKSISRVVEIAAKYCIQELVCR